MSSDPINIADDDAMPLELVWYAGPVRADGDNRTRLAITRMDGPRSSVNLSVTELARLANTAGVLRWEATPYGHPGWGDDDTADTETAPAPAAAPVQVWSVRVPVPYEEGYDFGLYATEQAAQERAAMPDVQQLGREPVVDSEPVWRDAKDAAQ